MKDFKNNIYMDLIVWLIFMYIIVVIILGVIGTYLREEGLIEI